MSESFDPYSEWLGIPPDEQPPHHYRILGLAPLEADRTVIEAAADRQMTHLRQYALGPHGEDSQRLLNEVSLACVVLVHPQKKAAYDAGLRETLERGGVLFESLEEIVLEAPHVEAPGIESPRLETLAGSREIQREKRPREPITAERPPKRPPPRRDDTKSRPPELRQREDEADDDPDRPALSRLPPPSPRRPRRPERGPIIRRPWLLAPLAIVVLSVAMFGSRKAPPGPGTLRLNITDAETVLLDGRPLEPERWNAALSLPPGRHTLELSAQGTPTQKVEFVIAPRQTTPVGWDARLGLESGDISPRSEKPENSVVVAPNQNPPLVVDVGEPTLPQQSDPPAAPKLPAGPWKGSGFRTIKEFNRGTSGAVWALAVSADGQFAVAAINRRSDRYASLVALNLETKKVVGELNLDPIGGSIEFHPDGRSILYLATEPRRSEIRRWQFDKNGAPETLVTIDQAWDSRLKFPGDPEGVSFSRDGRFAVAGFGRNSSGDMHQSCVIDLATRRPLSINHEGGDSLHNVRISPDGKFAAAISTYAVPSKVPPGNILRIWRVAGNSHLNQISMTPTNRQMHHIAFSADSRYLFALGPSVFDLRVFEMPDAKVVAQRLIASKGDVTNLIPIPGELACLIRRQESFGIVDVETGEESAQTELPRQALEESPIVIVPGSHKVITGHERGRIIVWELIPDAGPPE